MEGQEIQLDESTEGKYNEIGNLIRENKIKLWEEPYYVKGSGPQEEKLLELACNLTPMLDNMDPIFVLGGLKHWQGNALGKLEAREKLRKADTLVLKLKLAKNLRPKGDSNDNIPTSVEVPSDATGTQLAEAVAGLVKVEAARLKLISGGKVLRYEDTVGGDMGLRPGAAVMAVRIDRCEDQWKVVEEQKRILDSTRSDAGILGEAHSDYNVDIEDQSGKRLDLPREERRALITAMSFHEKGRASLKKKDYELALVLLLEASGEYKGCRSEILRRADNYALLNLDIAWCYLKLGSLSQLPDAEQRLFECESNFVASYGSDLERVVAVKGSADNERALYMRMHLLQGVVAFHKGHRHQAAQILSRAEGELKVLDVADDALAEVVALGFTGKEARLALRAEAGNVAKAVRHAQRAREERRRVAEEERTKARKRREYGRTASGEWVNQGCVSTLARMGFPEMYAVAALRQTDNDINAAVDIIQNKPELLIAAMAETNNSKKESGSSGYASNEEDPEAQNPKKERTEMSEEETRRRKQAEEAMDRLHEAIGDVGEDDHLDLALEEDRELLKKYQSFLGAQ